VVYSDSHKDVKKYGDSEGGFMEKKLRSVNDVPVICVNFTIIVIVVPEKRKDYFCIAPLYHSNAFIITVSQIEGFVTSTEQTIG
jgi:hypothetical protein